jgi:cation transport ATPase
VLVDVLVVDGVSPADVLRLAASADQLSAHVIAEALVHAATAEGLDLVLPDEVRESPGQGLVGRVGSRRVEVGNVQWLAARGYPAAAWPLTDGGGQRVAVHVAVDGSPAGVIVLADRLRPGAADAVGRLRREGVRHLALVTGDGPEVAATIGREVGVDRIYADQTPEAKLELVRSLERRADCRAVVMVGDGVNDAPALALADVGIAMAGEGATISSEAADAVIATGRIERVADAIHIGRRAMAIARQSIVVGIGLSVVAMGFAAAGYLPPVAGAVLQEGIDVAVILNALRALRA